MVGEQRDRNPLDRDNAIAAIRQRDRTFDLDLKYRREKNVAPSYSQQYTQVRQPMREGSSLPTPRARRFGLELAPSCRPPGRFHIGSSCDAVDTTRKWYRRATQSPLAR